MKVSAGTTWFLIASKASPSGFALISVKNGKLLTFTEAPPEVKQAAALTPTARGVATVLLKAGSSGKLTNFLTEFDPSGNMLQSTPMQCSWMGGLLSIGGKPSAICPNGVITTYPSGTQVQSWVRPGALAEVLSNGSLVIIDQATGQTILNDPVRALVSTVNATSPEIQEALGMAQVQTQAAARIAKSGSGAQPGRSIVVMDTASDASGWYALIWPYKSSVGPAVSKFDYSGRLVSRLQLQVPAAMPGLSQIESTGSKIILGSIGGDVLTYDLP